MGIFSQISKKLSSRKFEQEGAGNLEITSFKGKLESTGRNRHGVGRENLSRGRCKEAEHLVHTFGNFEKTVLAAELACRQRLGLTVVGICGCLRKFW